LTRAVTGSLNRPDHPPGSAVADGGVEGDGTDGGRDLAADMNGRIKVLHRPQGMPTMLAGESPALHLNMTPGSHLRLHDGGPRLLFPGEWRCSKMPEMKQVCRQPARGALGGGHNACMPPRIWQQL
jgi:hypothetical protein